MASEITIPISLRDRASAGIQNISNRVKSLKNGLNSLGSGTQSVSRSISTANTFLNSLNNTASRSPGLLSRIGTSASRILGVFTGFNILGGIFNSISSSVDTAIERIDTMDLFDKKMELITGDANIASTALDQLNAMTRGTAYYLNTAAKAVQNFVVRGMDTQSAVDSVNIWMDAVTAYGNGTNEQFESVTDAISKMRTKGTVEMRYLNRLFAAGINPVQMYAQATGQAASDVQQALSDKEISSEQFLSVVETAMREGTNGVKVVANSAKTMATTWKATLGNMRMAVARGTIDVIEGVSSVFEVLGTENGLKGLFKNYGAAMESFLSGTGTALTRLSTFFGMAINKVQSEHTESSARAAKAIEDNNEKIRKSYASAIDSFSSAFANTLGPQMENIVLAFQQVKVIWSDVKAALADGINQVSGAFGTFIGNYLGLSISGFADLSKAVGEFLKISIPKFFDFLEEKLNWLNENKDFVVSSIKKIIIALLSFKVLNGVAGTIAEIDRSIKGLNATLGVLSGGKFQIPTFASIAENKIFNAEVDEAPKKQDGKQKQPGIFKRVGTYIKDKLGGLGRATTALGTSVLNNVRSNPVTQAFKDQKLIKNGGNPKTLQLYKDFGMDEAVEKYKQRYSGGVLRDIFVEPFNTVKSGLRSVYDNAFRPVFQQIGNGFSTIGSGLATMAGNFASTFPTLTGFGSALLSSLPAIGLVVAAIGGLAVGLGVLNPGGKLSNGITQFFDKIKTSLPQFESSIVNGITTIRDKLIGAFSNGTLIQQGVDLVVSIVVGIMTTLPQIVATGFKVVVAFATAVLQAIPSLITAGFTAMKSFIDSMVNHFPEILSAWGEQIQSVVNTIGEYLPQIISAGAQIVVALATGIWDFIWFLGDKLWNGMWWAFDYLGSHFPEIMETVGQWFIDLGKGVVDWIIQGIHSAGGDWFLDAIGVDTEALKLADEAKQAAEQLAQAQAQVQTSGEDAFNWNDAWSQAIQQASDSAQQQVANISTSVDSLGDSGQAAGQEIANGITSGVDSASDYMSTAGEQAGQNYSSSVAGSVGSSTEQAQTNAVQLGQAITASFNGAIFENDSVHSTALTFLQNFSAGLAEGQDAVYSQMSRIANNALTVLYAGFTSVEVSMPDTIADGMTYMVDTVLVRTTEMCDTVGQNLRATVDDANGKILELKDNSVANFTEMKNSNVYSMQLMKTEVLSTLTSFVNEALVELDPFKTIGSEMASSMMEGLNNGIKDKTQAIVDTTSELVEKVKTVFVQGLGIHSPARVTYEYGGYTGEGWINGFSDADIVGFTRGVVDDMKAAFNGGRFDPNVLVRYLADNETVELIGYINKINGMENVGTSIAYPLEGGPYDITSGYGGREAPGAGASTFHQGIDIGAGYGTTILAALGGTVTAAGDNGGGYGNKVEIDHGNGLSSLYAHMSAITTSKGAVVTQGQPIGAVGDTGISFGAHLHFSMLQDGELIDPTPYLAGAAVNVGDPLATAIQNALNLKNGVGITGLGNIGYDVGAGASQWSDIVLQALTMLGQPASLVPGILYAIENESGGNPNAINNWDSNAQRGDPSRGLLQTIGATFNAYRNPNLSSNIYDPLANVYAALNYMMSKPGGIAKVISDRAGGWYGYAVGTRAVPQDMLAMIHKDEAIIPAAQNPYSNSGGDYLRDIAMNIFNSDQMRSTDEGYSARTSGGNVSNNNTNTFNVTVNQNINNGEDSRVSKEQIINLFHQIYMEIENGTPEGLHS